MASPSNSDSSVKHMSSFTRAAGFLAFIASGLLTLAAIVVLPEYVDLTELELRRQMLDRQLDCDRKLSAYNERLISSIQSDPVLAARLLMRQANYRLTGVTELDVGDDNRPLSYVPRKLLEAAQQPPAVPQDPVYYWGKWLDDGSTRLCLLAMSLGLLASGMLLFGPPKK
jgi:hypothetical protein